MKSYLIMQVVFSSSIFHRSQSMQLFISFSLDSQQHAAWQTTSSTSQSTTNIVAVAQEYNQV